MPACTSVTTSAALNTARAVEPISSREWSSRDVEDLHLRAAAGGVVGERPVGDVGLPDLVGQIRAERAPRTAGRLCGCAVTNPRRDRIRQIVETAGAGRCCCCRC